MIEHAIQLIESGNPREAMDVLRRVAWLRHDDPAVYTNMAIAFEAMGEPARAEHGYRSIIARWPQHVEAMSNLGNLLVRTARIDDAAKVTDQAVEATGGNDAYALTAQAMVKIEQLGIEDALPILKTVAEKTNHPQAWSQYLGYSLHVGGDVEGHHEWIKRFASHRTKPPRIEWDDKRPLRIGYLGNEFRQHACASMLEPVIANHDRSRVTPILYSDSRISDETTVRFQALGEWRQVSALSDRELYELIRRDQIDVLIDLMGHKHGSRPVLIAQRPAPVMLGYIGYAGDTGLTENIDRAVGWAYRPHNDAPPVSPLPALANGFITFGSVNRPSKITSATMRAWGRILTEIPASRLMVVVSGGEANNSARQKLVTHGVPSDRLELVPHAKTHVDYLAFANRMDIHLDTFPYNGGATTCDLLWQGVPSIVMDGDAYSMGAKIMQAIGLSSYVAGGAEDYIRRATELDAATSEPYCDPDFRPEFDDLRDLRLSMRERMFAFVDGRTVAARMENLCAERVKAVQAAQGEGCCG